MTNKKKNIALLLGDPSGIGPELISKLLAQNELKNANIAVIGEKNILNSGDKITGNNSDLEIVTDFDEINFDKKNKYFLDISKGNNKDYNLSECSAESGETVLNALNLALELAKEKKIDAINFGPFNKTSLKLGGCKFDDELHHMADKLNVKSFFCEFNVVDNFWTARVTSHIPIKEVSEHIKKDKIIKPIKLINEAISNAVPCAGVVIGIGRPP